MKFVLAANGSRGDVQPALAVGLELRSRGHDVVLLAPPNMQDFGTGAGLSTSVYGDSTRAVLESDAVRTQLKSADPRARLAAATEITVRGGRQMQQTLLDATADADAIIATSAGQERAHNVSQVRRIPHIPLHLCPIRRNSTTSMLSQLRVDASGPIASASWTVLEWLLWKASKRAENDLRAELGLGPMRTPFATAIAATGVPEIQAYDPVLFPKLVAEWGERRPLVGFLGLPASARAGVGDVSADDDLSEWIAAADAPVYVGFGSMLPKNPDRLGEAVVAAADRLGVRLLVASGWSDFLGSAGELGDRVRVVKHIDHDFVLPRCRAAIHHGGAGSVAASLRAGLPTVVTWIGADQPIWGRAVASAHAGTSLPLSRVTAKRLTDALGAALSPQMHTAAARVRDRLVAPSTAVSDAVDLAERVARGSR
ncbi:MAG: glycosyltransferase [Rhodococcus sp. (in: high G+C Gram-positive bacteria)]|uniref:glycosyltransferase n=1 Tax=Rhodococcus sp. TaxID=1831 RepID=UPI002AD82881|nr:glycosyltransferase [Rhodococcus sp. (in: high G+C Gram-positive bacteria)]MDZ7930481.1 glycosyltransferase [Rhodococcus sp. (in: high G+C Gram-positive bacteria)]